MHVRTSSLNPTPINWKRYFNLDENRSRQSSLISESYLKLFSNENFSYLMNTPRRVPAGRHRPACYPQTRRLLGE